MTSHPEVTDGSLSRVNDAAVITLRQDIDILLARCSPSWRIAALRNAAHDFASTLGSLLGERIDDGLRGRLTMLMHRVIEQTVQADHRADAITALRKIDQGQPIDLLPVVRAAIAALTTEREQLAVGLSRLLAEQASPDAASGGD